MNPITPAELTVQKSAKSIETRGESAVKCGGDDAERERPTLEHCPQNPSGKRPDGKLISGGAERGRSEVRSRA